MILFILLIILVLLLINYFVQEYFYIRRYIRKFPGPTPYPFVGNVFQVGFTLEENFKSLLKWWRMYGCDKYSGWILNQPYVILTDPKDVETVLSSTTLIEKGDIYYYLRPWLGNGLLTSTGVKWHKHRKMITPSFHFLILKDYLEIMDQNADNFIEILKKYADIGKPFDIQQLASHYTMDVICEAAFGTPIKLSGSDHSSEVITSVYKLCEIITTRVFSATKRFDFIFRLTSEYRTQKRALYVLRQFTSDIIEKRRELIKQKLIETNDENSNLNIKQKRAFLDNLLTAEIDGRPLTFDEIFEEVSTFMFEGHDTTKSAITFALYILSRYQDIQAKAFEEQSLIFSNDLKRTATYNELQEMNYLELVIKETLRLFPSVGAIARTTRDFYEIGGYTIPPNTTVVLFLVAMGLNEKYFKNACKVDPNRFSQTNRENENPFDSVPFSAGPRNCIGQKFAMLELKTVLSKILRNFEILPPYEFCCNETTHNHDIMDNRLDPPILSIAVTLKSENGVKLRLKRRSIE